MKYLIVAGIVIATIITYIIIGAMQPTVNELVASANASGNWTGFESAQAVVNSFPIYMWLIPGGVALVLIVITLKSGTS